MMMALPMVLRVVVGMLGVMRCLRHLIGMLAVDCLCVLYLDDLVLTRRCLRDLIGMVVVDRLCRLYLGCLGYLVLTRRCLRHLIGMLAVDCLGLLYLDDLVLTRFSVWLRTRHVGLLAGDNALRNSRGRRSAIATAKVAVRIFFM